MTDLPLVGFRDIGIQVDGLIVFPAETACEVELAQMTAIHAEVVNAQAGIYSGRLQQVAGYEFARSPTRKGHIIEIQQGKDVFQVDAVQVCAQGVRGFGRDATVNDELPAHL